MGKTITNIALIATFPRDKFELIGESHGISAIAGYIKSKFENINIHTFDQQIHSDKTIIERLKVLRPQIIGYSIKMGTLKEFEQLYWEIHKNGISPAYEICGNSFAHFNHEYLLTHYPSLIISFGEGEITFGDLIDSFNKGRNLASVRNIAYVQAGVIRRGNIEYLPGNEIPIADRTNSKTFYDKNGEVYIEGSRGCGYCACSICECRYFLGSSISSLKWRGKPIKSIMMELNQLVDLGIKNVTFSDEDFLGPTEMGIERIKEYNIGLVKLNRPINFRANIRVQSLLPVTEKLRDELTQLKSNGLVKVFLGYESGCQKQLNRYGKGFLINDIKLATKLLDEIEIEYELGYILFDPLVSLEEIKESLLFTRDNGFIENVSSIFKELRLQSGNKNYLNKVRQYENLNNVSLVGEYDIYTQEYPVIRYADSRVDMICKFIRPIVNESYKKYYSLRIATQYVPMKSQVDIFESTLIKELKHIEFDLIMSLIEVIEYHPKIVEAEIEDIIRYSKTKINFIMSKYQYGY